MRNQGNDLTRPGSASVTESTQADVLAATPPVDIYENVDELLVVADFPGVPKDSLNVRLDGSELVIEGTQEPAPEGMNSLPLRFSRTFRVPNTIDPGGISAELTQGVLRVHLTKAETAKPRRIEVKAN